MKLKNVNYAQYFYIFREVFIKESTKKYVEKKKNNDQINVLFEFLRVSDSCRYFYCVESELPKILAQTKNVWHLFFFFLFFVNCSRKNVYFEMLFFTSLKLVYNWTNKHRYENTCYCTLLLSTLTFSEIYFFFFTFEKNSVLISFKMESRSRVD